jgi:NitT/TauT family transport system ATP-binding protein
MPIFDLENVCKRFGPKIVFADLALTVERGETLTVVGASGSGKSVLLKLLIGLEKPQAGVILFDGVDLVPLDEETLGPVRRRMSMLFQGGALFDSLTVAENVAYPLRVAGGLHAHEIDARVAERLALVGLPDTQELRPSDLSGGMRKRVALAMTMVYDPEIVLMDEPFGALDVQTRNLMENDLLEIWAQWRRTVVFVTHDLEEAIALSDRLVVMSASPGRVKAVYPITLPRPRSVTEIRFHPDFGRLYETIWKDLKDEVRIGYERTRKDLVG